VNVGAHQEDAAAIVLYQIDGKEAVENGGMRFQLDPAGGPMCEEILVAGETYQGVQPEIPAGSVVAWRVGKTLVALRLLEGVAGAEGESLSEDPVRYGLSLIDGEGLCLDGSIRPQPAETGKADRMTCGFVVSVTTTEHVESLIAFAQSAKAWKIWDSRDNLVRSIKADLRGLSLGVVWSESNLKILERETNGIPCGSHPLYDSPLGHFRENLMSAGRP
jgi:hypothetical protein